MYYRVVKLSGTVYAKAFFSVPAAIKDISEFVNSGDVVMVCDDLGGVVDLLGVSIDEIVIVD